MIDVWLPIETAPKGVYREYITDKGYVEPPNILMYFPEEDKILICRYSFYRSPNGAGFEGYEAWIVDETGELAIPGYGQPTHWMPLPEPPIKKCSVNNHFEVIGK